MDFLTIFLSKLPVCSSTVSKPKFLAKLIIFFVGFIKALNCIFFFPDIFNNFFNFACDILFKLRPPSVVISFLFSGTIQINFGLILLAIFIISSVSAISRLIGILEYFFNSKRSLSFMCLLSSLK